MTYVEMCNRNRNRFQQGHARASIILAHAQKLTFAGREVVCRTLSSMTDPGWSWDLNKSHRSFGRGLSGRDCNLLDRHRGHHRPVVRIRWYED